MGTKEMEEQPHSSITRIFVGGLGQSVTASDLERTFSSLGRVGGVDIIRTNGRGFAYMDFEPTSEKSLSKLFSSYNGCIWKGGRLRLEKAKEHYLVRLRREWTEDTQKAMNPSATIDLHPSLEKLKHLTQENVPLRIFFPTLKKVKVLPYSGTGKHKYSFQRIEVPPLPVNFCDCEEHSKPFETVNHKNNSTHETHIGGLNKEELVIMNSVMERLFEIGTSRKTGDSRKVSTMGGNDANSAVDDVPMKGNDPKTAVEDVESVQSEEDEEEDDDDLRINISIGNSRARSVQCQGYEALPMDQHLGLQGSKSSAFESSKNDPGQMKLKSPRKLNKRPMNATDHHLIRDALEPAENGKEKQEPKHEKPKKRKILGKHFEEPKVVPETQPSETQTKSKRVREERDEPRCEKPKKRKILDTCSEERKLLKDAQPAEIQTELNLGLNKSDKGRSWLQKSSWKELVRETDDSCFRISHIVSGLPSVDQKLPIPSNFEILGSCNLKSKKPEAKAVEGNLKAMEFGKPRIPKERVMEVGNCNFEKLEKEERIEAGEGNLKALEVDEQGILKEKSQNEEENGFGFSKTAEKNIDLEQKTATKMVGGSEICTFMRSAESEREWSKARAALSGFPRKKSIGNAGSKKGHKGTANRKL